MSKISEELTRYFKFHGIRNTQIAEEMGMSGALVSNMLHGRDSIGKGRAMKLHETYGFNLRYLLTGEGELVPDITMTPDQLKAAKTKPQEAVTAPLPQMVDPNADMVSILLGQVAQLTSLVGQMRQENLALRQELNNKGDLV